MERIRSQAVFNEKMHSLNIFSGDILYIEAKLSGSSFNIIEINRMLNNLIDYLGPEGTIVMSLSGYNNHLNDKLALDRSSLDYMLPVNDRTMCVYCESRLANYMSLMKGAQISDNTFYPFVAIGKYANLIVNGQSFDFPNGNQSPFARLYELRAKALLINHDIKSFLLNEHVFDSSCNTVVKINGGVFENEYCSFLERKVDEKIMQNIFNSKKYKRIFYFTTLLDLPILSISVREYVDYTREIIEGY